MATLTLSGACITKAGTNVNASFKDTNAEALWEELILQAEGFICAKSKKNWIDDYATLNADVKYILEDTASSLAAVNAVAYDMSGYTTRYEAEDIINVLLYRANQNLKLLSDQNVVDFINGA